MRKRTIPKSVDFADFAPDAAALDWSEALDRSQLAGLPTEDAVRRILDFYARKRPLREVTWNQKEMVLKIVLGTLAKKQVDVSSVTQETMSVYREYLAKLVAAGDISESYASHIVKVWNSTARLAFGEKGDPGEGLVMNGFRMRPRKVERFDEAEMDQLHGAAGKRRFRSEIDKDAFEAYLEIERATGNRIGSLVYVVRGKVVSEATFGDINWEKGTIRYRHMKNRPEHEAVLTERALARLKQREEFLRAQGLWRGESTPILLACSGKSLLPQSVNRILRSVAAEAGILKPISTHRLRASVGTHIGRQNPRYGAEQLGITQKVFEAHYNQPNVDDRIARRDILPGGGGWVPRTAEEIIGQAWLDRGRGLISENEFKAALLRAQDVKTLPGSRPAVPETSAYG